MVAVIFMSFGMGHRDPQVTQINQNCVFKTKKQKNQNPNKLFYETFIYDTSV